MFSALKLPGIPDEFGHMPGWLLEAGECSQNGGSFQPLPFTEIESWARQTGKELTEFEAGALHKMSRSFANMLNCNMQDEPCPISLPDDEPLQEDADMMAAVATWKALATSG